MARYHRDMRNHVNDKITIQNNLFACSVWIEASAGWAD